MGEQKKTLFEIHVENFEFSPSPRLGGELGKTLKKYEETGSKLGLFGSKGESDDEVEEVDDEEESGGLFSSDADDEDSENAVEDVDDVEGADDESGGGIGLVIGLLFLLVVAAVAKKFVAEDEPEEYEEVELSEYEN